MDLVALTFGVTCMAVVGPQVQWFKGWFRHDILKMISYVRLLELETLQVSKISSTQEMQE